MPAPAAVGERAEEEVLPALQPQERRVFLQWEHEHIRLRASTPACRPRILDGHGVRRPEPTGDCGSSGRSSADSHRAALHADGLLQEQNTWLAETMKAAFRIAVEIHSFRELLEDARPSALQDEERPRKKRKVCKEVGSGAAPSEQEGEGPADPKGKKKAQALAETEEEEMPPPDGGNGN